MPSIDVMPALGPPSEAPPEEPPAPPPPVIGIIYPPPEVRNIVDKTASFVARNGPEFEARIRQNELGNPKFNFLNSGDPYHAYYQHKVKEIREGKGPEPSAPPLVAPARPGLAPATAARQQELLKAAAPAEPPPPRDPPPDFEFIADPPSISALELDIVKLTAQFVARNGRQFLTDLMKKEERNHQFDFLRPQHSLFQYFTRLLEQYTKVLLPPKELVNKLGMEIKSGVLDQARSRAAWHSHQARRKAADEARIEKERLAYASIDWHDFVVVETVDYPAGEPGDFPPPTTPLEVGARVLAQERGEDITHGNQEDDDTEMQLESDSESESDEDLAEMEDRTQQQQRPDDNRVQDMEEESSSSDDEGVEPPRPPEEAPVPPRPDRVIVKKYDPKKDRPQPTAASEEWLVSPITGEKIPANKVADHMRIGLLDPRWLEQRDRAAAERTDRDEALAPGAAIEASLKQLAERRTDIFGVGDEETAIGKKIGEEDKRRDDRVTWDGHTSSVEAATRAARAHITLEDQIQQIHKVKGLLPDEEKEKIGPKPVPASGRGAPRAPPPAPPPLHAARAAPVLLQPIPPLMVIPPLAPRPPLIPTPVGERAAVRVQRGAGAARGRGGPGGQAAAHRGRAGARGQLAGATPRARHSAGVGAVAAGALGVAAGRARAGAVAAAGHQRRRRQGHAAALHQHAASQAEAALRGSVLQRHQQPGVLQRTSRRRDPAASEGERRPQEITLNMSTYCRFIVDVIYFNKTWIPKHIPIRVVKRSIDRKMNITPSFLLEGSFQLVKSVTFY